jgi:hypothetical protein
VATRVVTPRLAIEPRWVAGPPKRFAQGIGAAFSLSALALAFGFRRPTAAYALVGILGVFATLEAAFGFCLGCKVFAILMRLGIVPEEVCADCNNIWARAVGGEGRMVRGCGVMGELGNCGRMGPSSAVALTGQCAILHR